VARAWGMPLHLNVKDDLQHVQQFVRKLDFTRSSIYGKDKMTVKLFKIALGSKWVTKLKAAYNIILNHQW